MMAFNLTLNAQTRINYNSLSNNAGGIGTMDATLMGVAGVEGSPFLYENWNNFAIVYINNGEKIQTQSINFNIEKSKFSSKISKDSIFIFDNIDKVEINDKVFVKLKSKFYESLVTREEGNLLKEYTVKIEPELHKITSTVIGPGKYKKESKYFYYEKGILKKIKLKKKDILKVLSSKKGKVLEYVKGYKLSFNKEKDIIKIFKFYDSL